MTLSELTSHLPTRDTIQDALTPRTHRSVGEYAGVLSLGLIAGAALALLLAPKSGRVLRGQISERVAGLRKRAKRSATNGFADDRADLPS